jgi:two-component system chemotaxis response regulator CheY
LETHLEFKGCGIVEADHWDQVSSLVNHHHFQAIITEWFDAFQDTTLLSSSNKLNRIPIFLFTKLDLQQLPPYWKDLGFAAFFSKKRKLGLLQAVLEAVNVSSADTDLPRSSGPKHVLLIDDSSTTRGFVRRALESGINDLVVREAEDGRSALAEMTQKKVDLIITDIEMPGMDGHTFLRLVRNNPVLKQKPIIVLSASYHSDLVNELEKEPLVRLLRKPSSPTEIQEAVRQMLLLTTPLSLPQ